MFSRVDGKKIAYLFLVGFIVLPNVGGLDFSIFSLFSAFVLAVSSTPTVYINRNLMIFIGLLAICWLFLIAQFFILGGREFDPQFMFKPPRIILIVLFLLAISSAWQMNMTDALRVIVVASLINAIVVYLQYFLHFSGITDSFLLNPNTGQNALTPYRKPGLMAGYPISGMLSLIGALSSAYMYYRSGRWFWKAGFILCGFPCFITSRTSLYLFATVGFLYFVWVLFRSRDYMTLIFVGAVILVSSIWIVNTDNPIIQGTKNKMLANVYNYLETGSFHDYSTSDLFENHYILPSDELTLLRGTALPNNMAIVNSDVSFFRMTWYGGLGFSFYMIFLFTYVLISIVLRSVGAGMLLWSISLVLIMLVANAKGSYVFSRVLGDLILMVWIFLYGGAKNYVK